MAKYRTLSGKELEELEKEFIEYLVINGITVNEWDQLKKDDPEKVDRIIELFSDVVFEGVMRKVEFLQYRNANEVRAFQCLSDKVILASMTADAGADFTNPDFIQQAISHPPSSLRVSTTEKPYGKQRELELFELVKAGCEISDGTLFKAICMVAVQGK